MKKLLMTTLTLSLIACSQPQNVTVGADENAHGCKESTGASYSFLLKECVQVFNVAQIKLNDPKNSTAAIYGIQSADKAQVELFGIDFPENTILETVKGGYASADGKIRLMKTAKGWELHQ